MALVHGSPDMFDKGFYLAWSISRHWLAGVGMNFNITEILDARVRFERMIGVESAYDDYHMDNLTAGIAYRL